MFQFCKRGLASGNGGKTKVTIKMLLLNDSGRSSHVKSIQSRSVFRIIKQIGSLALYHGHNQVQSKDLNVKENSFADIVLQFMLHNYSRCNCCS